MKNLPGRVAVVVMLAVLVTVGGFAFLAHLGAPATGHAGAASAGHNSTVTPCPTDGLRTAIAGSYAAAFPATLHDLKALSAVAADVTIVGATGQWLQRDTSGTKVVAVYTVYSARVVHGLKGIADGALLSVIQIGGYYQCSDWSMRGDPLFQPGEQDVLFLTQSDSQGRYGIVQDTVGRFIVAPDGTVGPLNTQVPHLSMTALGATSDVGSIPLATFLGDIRSA